MSIRRVPAPCILLCFFVAAGAVITSAQGRGPAPQGRGGAAATPRTSALADLTGTWVSLVTEDWRYRMFAAPKGDVGGIPVSAAGRKMAEAWDPAKDEAAGEQCKAYGAAGLMRLPTRLRISWQDENALKIETDAGTQTRLLHFGAARGNAGGWQGLSVSSWEYPRALFPGRGGAPPGGSLKVITTQMRPGYLRRNGVPYGARAVMTEYFTRLDVPGGDSLLVVAAEIVDPDYLETPYWMSVQFKRQNDASGWNPTPCAAR